MAHLSYINSSYIPLVSKRSVAERREGFFILPSTATTPHCHNATFIAIACRQSKDCKIRRKYIYRESVKQSPKEKASPQEPHPNSLTPTASPPYPSPKERRVKCFKKPKTNQRWSRPITRRAFYATLQRRRKILTPMPLSKGEEGASPPLQGGGVKCFKKPKTNQRWSRPITRRAFYAKKNDPHPHAPVQRRRESLTPLQEEGSEMLQEIEDKPKME